MGQSVSVANNNNKKNTKSSYYDATHHGAHGSSRLSFRARSSKGAKASMLQPSVLCDDHSSRSTMSTEESSPSPVQLFWDNSRVRPSREDTVAAIETVNAFFAGSELATSREEADSSGAQQQQIVINNDGQRSHPNTGTCSSSSSRSSSRPVKCPPARRPRSHEASSTVEQHHLVSSSACDDNEDLEEDVQYLKRLYDMRSWDMYVRITEFRRRQGYTPRYRVPEQEPRRHCLHGDHETDFYLPEADLDPSEVSPNHEMIFACDLE